MAILPKSFRISAPITGGAQRYRQLGRRFERPRVQHITNREQNSAIRVKGPPGGVPVSVVVVSNRVARAKPDEPLAGGLAAALLPMVRDSGAIWVGSSGQSSSSDASQARGSFARIEALG